MVALPPLAATTTFAGLNRPVPVSQPGTASDAARAQDLQAAGSAASAKIRQQQDKAQAAADQQAAAQAASANEGRQAPALPNPPYSQNVGLFDNSFRVFVDIVLSGGDNRTVARVFGTPPASKQDTAPSVTGVANRPASAPVNIVA
jgi:hypothetical protein